MLLYIYFLCMLVFDLIYLILRCIKMRSCKNVTKCKDRKCHFSCTCKKYDDKLTHEEYLELIAYLEELRNKNL